MLSIAQPCRINYDQLMLHSKKLSDKLLAIKAMNCATIEDSFMMFGFLVLCCFASIS